VVAARERHSGIAEIGIVSTETPIHIEVTAGI
jgi:hypothetical protein